MADQAVRRRSAHLGDWLAATRAELVVIGGMPFALGAALGEASALRTVLAGAAGAVLQVACGLVNSVADRHADAIHPRKLGLPLVTGRIRPAPALAAAGAALLVFGGLALAVATTVGSFAALGVVGAVQVYGNVQQKRSRHVPPPVMDLLFGATFGVPVLALALGPSASERSVALLALVVSLDAVALNVLVGNVKDLQWDARVGDRTTALALGVTTDERAEPPALRLTTTYRATAMTLLSLRTIALAVAVVPDQAAVGVAAAAGSAAGIELWRRATEDGRLGLLDRRPFAFVAIDLATFLVACAATRPTTAMLVAILATVVLAPAMAAITRARPPTPATPSS